MTHFVLEKNPILEKEDFESLLDEHIDGLRDESVKTSAVSSKSKTNQLVSELKSSAV